MSTDGTPKKRKKSGSDWGPTFLEVLKRTGNITRACIETGVPRRSFYNRRDDENESKFKTAVREALTHSCDLLEEEARRRAYEGLERKKFDRGVPIIDPATREQYVEREYSDTLLIFLLKAHRPKKFRENVKHEHTGANGGPLDLSKVPDNDLNHLHKCLVRATGAEPARNGSNGTSPPTNGVLPH